MGSNELNRCWLPQVNRRPEYSESELAALEHQNELVPFIALGAFGAVVLIFTIANALSLLIAYYRRRKAAAQARTGLPRAAACSRSGKVCSRWVPGLVVAAFRKLAYRRSRVASALGMTSLGEIAGILAWWLLNFLLMIFGARWHIDYIAHHAARLVYANLPIVIGLASKNNVISLVTGFSYESLNVFHRWVARLLWVFSVIHIAGRLYVNYPVVDPSARGGAYIIYGAVAFFLLSFMYTGAARMARNKWYSFFIITHVILFVFSCIALAIHRPQLAPFIYVGFAVYFIDRIWRTLRIVWHHAIRKLPTRATEEGEPAPGVGMVEVVSPDTLRVSVETTLTWIPAQHVYLHCPLLSAGGHPFSVASIDRPLSQTDDKPPTSSTVVLLIRVRQGLTRHLHRLAMGDDESETVVWRKRRGSLTLDAVSPKVFPTAYISPIWAEGAYGNRNYLDYCQTLVLISGGSGVSFALALMLDIVRRARGMMLGVKDMAVAVERLTFVWTIREEAHVDWIEDYLLEAIALAPPDFLTVRIHVTGKKFMDEAAVAGQKVVPHARPASRPASLHPKKQDGPDIPLRRTSIATGTHTAGPGEYEMQDMGSSPQLEASRSSATEEQVPPSNERRPFSLLMRPGRPNIRRLLEHEIEATPFQSYVAVGTCGPTPMTEDCSNAVCDAIDLRKVARGENRRNIRLHCEEFGW